VPALAEKGIKDTGNNFRVHRNGPVVTAGGLIFMAHFADRTVRAYDKDTGKILWEKPMEANFAGIPSVYQVNGRQFVAFFGGCCEKPAEGNIAWVGASLERRDTTCSHYHGDSFQGDAMRLDLILFTMFLGVILTVHLSMNGAVGAALNNARVGNALFWCVGALTALIVGMTGWRPGALAGLRQVNPVLLTAGAMGACLVFAIRVVDSANRRRTDDDVAARRTNYRGLSAFAFRLARLPRATDKRDEARGRRTDAGWRLFDDAVRNPMYTRREFAGLALAGFALPQAGPVDRRSTWVAFGSARKVTAFAR
jgi:hypothetical protein